MSAPDSPPDLVLRSRRVVHGGRMGPASVHVRGERIAAVAGWDAVPPGVELHDHGELVILPGLVDTHVHVNDPGRTDWEGFATATAAAAAGGVTTIVDMPLNSVPSTTDVAALAAKLAAAEGQLAVDVGFWGGVVPGNVRDLEPLARAGVRGFKCFLSPSGVDEFAHVGERDLRLALPVTGSLRLPLLAHAEWPALLREPRPEGDRRLYSTWLRTRPPAAEHAAIDLLIDLAGHAAAKLHIVHLASADALPAIDRSRAMGLDVTVETCPHYLSFCAEEIAAGATAWKCAPPIRERGHRERLWRALGDGRIDLVATDHSPAPPSLKHLGDGDFMAAWGGIASLQLALPVMWTGARQRGLPFERLAEWMSAAPARLAGLEKRKGAIAIGHDADLVIVDPGREFTVEASRLYHRHAVTPYDGARLHGVVQTTMVGGEIVYDNGTHVGSPAGRLI